MCRDKDVEDGAVRQESKKAKNIVYGYSGGGHVDRWCDKTMLEWSLVFGRDKGITRDRL